MNKIFIILSCLAFLNSGLIAQVSITTDGADPAASAMVDIVSTNRGILFPRVSDAGRNAIPSPATGLLVYNTTTNLFNFFNGTYWYSIPSTFVSAETGAVRPGGGVSVSETIENPPDSSAILDVVSSVKGVLIPRTDPASIPSPAAGMIVYNSTTNHLAYFNGTAWIQISAVATGQAGAAGSQTITGVAIRSDGSTADQSAILDVSSPDRGFLIPRMSALQRDEISPVTGLMIYNTNANSIEYYDGTGWYKLNAGFSCGQPFVDTRDSQSYNTTQIGTQCWMAQSLNYGLMIANNTQMANDGMAEKWCYDNAEAKCLEYGALYQWDEAMQYSLVESTQGICPAGWHIPSEAEWDILDDFLGGYNNSGGPMKETGTVHWVSPNSGATNTSGFSGRGAGYNDYKDATPPTHLRTHNYIWSSTQYQTEYARRRLLLYLNYKSNPYFDLKWLGFSVRCVMN